MLDTCGELLERMIRSRLEKNISDRGGRGLHVHQYGFRKKISTVNAVRTVQETVKKIKKTGKEKSATIFDSNNIKLARR